MSSFTDLWQRRERAARELLHAERAVETYVNDEDAAAYEDIFGAPRNRLRFDDIEGSAQQSTSAFEAILAGYLTRLRACQAYEAPECACAFADACEHACPTCAQICVRAHAGAHMQHIT